MRLIDADALKLKFMENGDDHTGYEIHRVIDNAPTVDAVAVRHGHWVMFDHAMSMWNVWVCSECGYRRKEGWMHTEAGKKPEAQYCENCMAKMDGGVNDGGD